MLLIPLKQKAFPQHISLKPNGLKMYNFSGMGELKYNLVVNTWTFCHHAVQSHSKKWNLDDIRHLIKTWIVTTNLSLVGNVQASH